MAKKKSRKRAWTGAPPPRPSGGTRPGGGPRPSAAAPTTRPPGAVTTDEAETEATPTPAPPRPAAKPARSAPAAPQPISHRTARKEEARRQRELIRRKEARRRKMRRYGIMGGGVLAVGAVAALIVISSSGGGLKTIDPRTLPGISTDRAPWPAEVENLSARIAKMGLPPLGGEAQAYHIHQNLVVYVNGTQEPIPTGLGSISTSSLAEIHTHDGSGTIHIEAGATRRFTLGTIFDVWGVLFTPNQIGAYKSHGDTRIRVFSNGKPVTGDPTQLPLRDTQVIVVTYGTPAQVPDPIPSVFHYAAPPTVPKAKAEPSASPQPSASAKPSAAPSASPS